MNDLVYESTFESHENMVVGAAILCSAICVCDVMNDVAVHGKVEKENSNSNSNSKTLFSKDCSLGSFRPV